MTPARPIVVGISDATPDRVLDEAVGFARDLGVQLLAAYVDETRVPVGEAPDGTVISAPVAAGGPCTAAAIDDLAGSELGRRVSSRASDAGVVVAFHALAGDPVTALSRFAVDQDARAIVVGTRKPGLRSGIELLIAGPVASRLAYRQPVPVIAVPVHDRAPRKTAEYDRDPASSDTDASLDVPDPADVLYGEGHA
ncbi:universal stress protein [Gryllotalpicola ginsengisoli]|uniref:universal stress protein n=1 Tax=Gryllotalpicola ginsengisoli TaxID=444608 RepID=UPI0003B58D87|nr:universal stress protein [Gryllotalpicola ginsengisoli]